jgi:hypothetical protein
MHEARAGDQVYVATDFAELPTATRLRLRELLTCTACGADAYFIREARNGRSACFGARPHEEGCELASLATEDGGSASLDDDDQLTASSSRFRLEPYRPRLVRHIRHTPGGAPHAGSGRRYTRPSRGGVRTPSVSIDRLLRRLVREPDFRTSRAELVLANNTRAVIADYCINVREADEDLVGRKRLYWGTIRFPRPADDDGAWLNTGSRSLPTVKLDEVLLADVLEDKDIDDIDDLSGAAFAFLGYLRRSAAGKLLLFPEDPEWFVIRLFDEDEVN